MKKSTILNIVRIVLTWLWRLVLTAAVVCGLGVLGIAMVLNLVFNGPSVSARDQLTLTLLESERTSAIPGYFLKEETIAAIRGSAVSPSGYTDPNLITVHTGAQAQATPFSSEHYDALISRIPDSAAVRLTANHAGGSSLILCGSVTDSTHFAGITPSGILQLTDDAANLRGTEAVPCGQILIWDGVANESLYACNSGFAPRTAIGQTANGTLIFITTDGWTGDHPGATVQDMMNLMLEQGAVNACLLGQDAQWIAPKED